MLCSNLGCDFFAPLNIALPFSLIDKRVQPTFRSVRDMELSLDMP